MSVLPTNEELAAKRRRRTRFAWAIIVLAVFVALGTVVSLMVSGEAATRDRAGLTAATIDENAVDPEAIAAAKRPGPAQSFDGEAGGMAVHVDAEEGAFPAGTTMTVAVVGDDEVAEALDSAVEGEVVRSQAFDIAFWDANGDELEPQAPVHVSFHSAFQPETEQPVVVHVSDEGDAVVMQQQEDDASTAGEAVTVSSEEFSIYIYAVTKIEKNILASDGRNYKITVTYNDDAQIPQGTELVVSEVDDASKQFDEYLEQAESALGLESGTAGYARFFDIALAHDGAEVQPATPVTVKVELADAQSGELSVVHFEGEGAEKPEVVDAASQTGEVNFEAAGFSVYAIVQGPAPEMRTATSLDELAEGEPFHLASSRGFMLYFTNVMASSGNPPKIGNTRVALDAASYTFERIEGTSDQFRVYTTDPDGNKVYMNLTGSGDNGEMSLDGEDDAEPTVYTVEQFGAGFYIYSAQNGLKYGINRFSGENSPGFAGWKGKDDGSRILVVYPPEGGKDLLKLNGKTYGIVNQQSYISGYAMMAQKFNDSRLERKYLVTRQNPEDENGALWVAQGADVPQWTFHAVNENVYYLTTTVNGATKYLKATSKGLALVDEAQDDCQIQIQAGTGNYAGKVLMTARDGSIVHMHANGKTNGFGTTTNAPNASSWMSFVQESKLKDEDFTFFSATKVSVSDTQKVTNGSKVIVYTRVWNDSKKEYEFYAIDHAGALTRVYEDGDMLQWVGNEINTLQWEFTEYYFAGTTNPNYYYELQNTYSGQYLAPQINGGQILSDSTIGINMNGRRNGEYYSTILAWDDPHYDYAGLKVEGGQLASCPRTQAQDFYFAIMDEPVQTPQLNAVETVDSNEYGISMSMIDYSGTKANNGTFDQTQTDVYGDTGNTKDLMKPYLEEDGYPVSTKTGKSLGELYQGTQPVNHLFLQSTYDESGYFEYNCTENFAHLNSETGDFVVYDKVGTIETSNVSLNHGQFMPYNDLVEGRLSNSHSNVTDELDRALPPSDPRKDMDLYTIPYNQNNAPDVTGNANYHFGMQMQAAFTQTANGLDDWGHDIIFEFAGDDDMFLYVDGMLVLDLGGVHAAQSGKVNFRTGQITTSSRGSTTLLAQFQKGYKAQHPEASQDEVDAWLKGIFKTDASGKLTSVFADYSTHRMKMFYMERGAGASNLHMRFNLASVKPGTVMLSKTMSGTDEKYYSLTEFPYQIWYRTAEDGPFRLLGSAEGDRRRVRYVGKGIDVHYAQSFTPAGGGAAYDDVFFLKPGEAVEIEMPENAVSYYITECGLDPRVYAKVSANGEELAGKVAAGNPGREDYSVAEAAVSERQAVAYDNELSPDAQKTLTITKRLFKEDGVTPLGRADDDTTFDLRLYLGSENDTSLGLANMYGYHVLDANGNYCKWDSAQGKFASLGKSSFGALTDAEKDMATFATSINGSISRIPVDYTVEVRNLIVGTKFRVEEREGEIPEGYSFQKYVRVASADTVDYDNAVTPAGTVIDPPSGETAESGSIRFGADDPAVEVRNLRGWGLTAKKVWSDASYMQDRDPIYFAVYLRGDGDGAGGEGAGPGAGGAAGDDDLELVDGTLRQMAAGQTSLYWYFRSLQPGKTFDDYVLREVTVKGQFSVDDEGYVHAGAGGGGPAADADGGDGDGGDGSGADGGAEGGSGGGAEGGDAAGTSAGTVSGTGSLTVTPIEQDGSLTCAATPVGGTSGDYTYTVSYDVGTTTGGDNNVRTDTVTNSRPGIAVVKTDMQGNPLAGARFTLLDGDGNAIGSATYTSDENGLVTVAYLPDNGTYTLTEAKSPQGFQGLTGAITITSKDGKVTVAGDEADEGMYAYDADGGAGVAAVAGGAGGAADGAGAGAGDTGGADGGGATQGGAGNTVGAGGTPNVSVASTITVKNRPFSLKVVKVDEQTGNALLGVHFAIYRQVANSTGQMVRDTRPVDGYGNLVTDARGLIAEDLSGLKPGTYYLTETQKLDNYKALGGDVVFTIGDSGTVTAIDAEYCELTSQLVGPDGEPVQADGTEVAAGRGAAQGDGTGVAAGQGAAQGNGDGAAADQGAAQGDGDGATQGIAPDVKLAYLLKVKNTKAVLKLSVQKVDSANHAMLLNGAVFDLYKLDGDQREQTPLYQGLVSGDDGMLSYTESADAQATTVFPLETGVYHLVETTAPDGYNLKGGPVIVTVTSNDVSYDDESSNLSYSGTGKSFDPVEGVYTIKVINASGFELPSTGGPGTYAFYALGFSLVLLAVGLILLRRAKA